MIGMRKYNNFYERRRILQSIYDGSIKIKETIRCTCAPLHESFLWGGDFFELASKKIGEGLLPEEAVNESAWEFCSLTAEDRSIIFRFAHGLSAADCKGQLSNLELFTTELEKALQVATNDLNTRGKLCVKGSILTAAAVVLLLI